MALLVYDFNTADRINIRDIINSKILETGAEIVS